jgi:D-inositol-3-phosphate glycosyltransferase
MRSVAMLSPYRRRGGPILTADDTALNVYTRFLTRALAGRGVRISILAPRSDRDDRCWEDDGVPIVPSYRRGSISAPYDIARTLAKRSEPILHVQFELRAYGGLSSGFLLLPVLASYRRKLRIVTTIHGLPSARAIDAGLAKRTGLRAPLSAVRAVLRALGTGLAKVSDRLIVPAAAQRALLVEEYSAAPERVAVIHSGVDEVAAPPSREESRRRLDLPPEAIVILFLGFWAPYKRLDLLIPAIRTWLERGKNRFFILAGTSSPRYQRRDASLSVMGADRFRVCGFVPTDESPYYFRAADALVMPYDISLGSATLTSALAYDLPVLVSRPLAAGYGMSNSFDLTHDGIVEILERFAEQPELRKQVRQESAALKATHGWSQHAALTEGLYKELLAERPATG